MNKPDGSLKKLQVTRDVVRLLKNGSGVHAGGGTSKSNVSSSVDPTSVISWFPISGSD